MLKLLIAFASETLPFVVFLPVPFFFFPNIQAILNVYRFFICNLIETAENEPVSELAQNIIGQVGTKMLLCSGFIVIIAVAFSVYGGFRNLVNINEMEGALKVRKYSNLFHVVNIEAPVVVQPTMFTRSDQETAGDRDDIDNNIVHSMWLSSRRNFLGYLKQQLFPSKLFK